MHFCYFLKKFFEDFRKFSSVRGARPSDPLLGRPPKVFPQNRNPGRAAVLKVLYFLGIVLLIKNIDRLLSNGLYISNVHMANKFFVNI